VASRLGALADLVDDGVNGLLFDPGNPRDLADKVRQLWENPDLCRRLGRAARQKAIERWAPERHFARLHELYRDLCA
jgi:glycosyltransferase involved in cell wall biosynthesis